ncbi:uncharacterized protein LOC115631188 [Scaptodrosophila lebanonensis]|uniref:Uncharacterized protein LOC115631188 n=1 Tax=Drosophila lebanonensis TaxID=7225 RepID=A0A6J2U5X4_DROLE|nr:uncharacterized protein LOC115631188 [Scaptodrosophila lebanonensis]
MGTRSLSSTANCRPPGSAQNALRLQTSPHNVSEMQRDLQASPQMTSTGYTVPSLLQLNDDVLALILRQLNLYEQFELAQLHSRLESIRQTLWRTRVQNVLLWGEMFAISPPKPRHFLAFIQALVPHMEHLCLQNIDVRKLRLLSGLKLPAVHTLEWLGLPTYRGRLVDEDVRLLQRVFPSLRTLKLRSCRITGKYLGEFPLLTELSLDDCHHLDSEHFREIFRQLRLRKFDIMEDCDEVNCCDLVDVQQCLTLEHIKIADYHLCMEEGITQDLLRMPALHKLSIYSKNFVFDVLERIARHGNGNDGGKVIDGFRFSGTPHNFERLFRELGNLRHLRRLAVDGCCSLAGNDVECITDYMLLELSQKLPELCELRFSGCELESYRGLLHFVVNCRQLRLLDITRSRRIGDSFVWRCLELLVKQKWRTQPLELWIRQSDIDNNIVQNPRFIPNDKLLKIDSRSLTHNMEQLSGVLKFTFVR